MENDTISQLMKQRQKSRELINEAITVVETCLEPCQRLYDENKDRSLYNTTRIDRLNTTLRVLKWVQSPDPNKTTLELL